MPDELDDHEADDALPDSRTVTVVLPFTQARELLGRKDLHPAVAERLQNAFEREHPSDETMTNSVKRTIARWYRAPGDAA